MASRGGEGPSCHLVTVSRHRSGFTLFELILVLAVLAVLTAAVYPSIEAMNAAYKLSGAGDMVRAVWADAQAHAINEGRPYRFALTPYTGNFRVAPDSGGFWTGNNSDPVVTDSPEPPFVREGILPRGARFEISQVRELEPEMAAAETSGNGSGDMVTVAIFLPDGTAREDAEVRLTARGARSLILRLRGLTGMVTLKPAPLEGPRR